MQEGQPPVSSQEASTDVVTLPKVQLEDCVQAREGALYRRYTQLSIRTQ